MSKRLFEAAFAIGCVTVAWIGWGFVGSNALALAMTAVIAGVFLAGAHELRQFRRASAALAQAVDADTADGEHLDTWLKAVPANLRPLVRQRVEGERVGWPGPVLTPYLVGLLVMLGMLGTFLGLVVTFRGAVFTLEASTDLQAMRSALAEPIRGLALSFGTSVAGVAASAMLGLMSALSRRERLEVARRLDARIGGTLRTHSLAHHRSETLRALQQQSHALPAVVERLDALMSRLEERHQALDDQLVLRQARFHEEMSTVYTGLAREVGQALQASLVAGSQAAGERIEPVISAAMDRMLTQSGQLHDRLATLSRQQVDALSTQFSGTAQSVAAGWDQAMKSQVRANHAVSQQLREAFDGFSVRFDERSQQWLDTVAERAAEATREQAAQDEARLAAWSQRLEATATELHAQWHRAGETTQARQQAVCDALDVAAQRIAEHTGAAATRVLGEADRLLASTQGLVQARVDAEAHERAEHAQRMAELAALWRSELEALREAEARRGDAAVDRLGQLEAAVSQHLAQLGGALEEPLTRLLETAAQVPHAAAGVIGQLREQVSGLAERDNVALREREALMSQLGALLESVQQATGEQKAAVSSLVAAADAMLEQAGGQFATALQSQANRAGELATSASASALELASLGEAFGQGVSMFQASSDKLMETLLRVEASIERSTSRSDEQLAYYVAQAREVIDLSIASQQGLLDHLRQLQSPGMRVLALADGDTE